MGFQVNNLTIDDIYSNSDIIYRTIPELSNYKLKKKINSPLRIDKNPSFSLIEYNGTIFYKDSATDDSGNVVHFIAKYNNITYKEAIKICLNILDFGTVITKKSNSIIKENITVEEPLLNNFKVEYKNWDNYDENYWKQFGINLDILNLYNVKPVSKLYCYDVLRWVGSKFCPIYSFSSFKNTQKFYRPYALKRSKWIGNMQQNCIFGYSQFFLLKV